MTQHLVSFDGSFLVSIFNFPLKFVTGNTLGGTQQQDNFNNILQRKFNITVPKVLENIKFTQRNNFKLFQT